MIYTKHFLGAGQCSAWRHDSKESACNAEDLGLIPGSVMQPWGRECNMLQYSFLENHMTEETSGL